MHIPEGSHNCGRNIYMWDAYYMYNKIQNTPKIFYAFVVSLPYLIGLKHDPGLFNNVT
jgi:hypothetical protein